MMYTSAPNGNKKVIDWNRIAVNCTNKSNQNKNMTQKILFVYQSAMAPKNNDLTNPFR